MRKLRVLGTRPSTHPFPLFSWGIRLIEGSSISHVVVELPEEYKIYHARFNQVGFIPIGEFKQKNKIVYSYDFEIADDMYEAMLDFMVLYAGKKHGYFKLLFGAMIPHLIRRLFNKYIHNIGAKGMKDAALCSQLVRYLALRFWSFKVPELPYQENFTTTDVIEMMKDNLKQGQCKN